MIHFIGFIKNEYIFTNYKKFTSITKFQIETELQSYKICNTTGELGLILDNEFLVVQNISLVDKDNIFNPVGILGTNIDYFYDISIPGDFKFFKTKTNLNIHIYCGDGLQKTEVGFLEKTTSGRYLLIYPISFFNWVLSYVIYFPSLYFIVSLEYQSFSFMLIIMNSLVINDQYDLLLRFMISLILSMMFSNINDTIKRKNIHLIKLYKIKRSLKNENNCLRKFLSDKIAQENVYLKFSRSHVSPGKYKMNKLLFLRIYFSGLLMKPLTEFSYFQILFALFNSKELNILKNSFEKKLFNRQGYTKDFDYFLQSLRTVSNSYHKLKEKKQKCF
jgi:hypothetical protein